MGDGCPGKGPAYSGPPAPSAPAGAREKGKAASPILWGAVHRIQWALSHNTQASEPSREGSVKSLKSLATHTGPPSIQDPATPPGRREPPHRPRHRLGEVSLSPRNTRSQPPASHPRTEGPRVPLRGKKAVLAPADTEASCFTSASLILICTWGSHPGCSRPPLSSFPWGKAPVQSLWFWTSYPSRPSTAPCWPTVACINHVHADWPQHEHVTQAKPIGSFRENFPYTKLGDCRL